MSFLLYFVTLLIICLLFVHHPIDIFHLSFLYTKDNPTQEDHLYRSINNVLSPIYPQNTRVKSSEQNRLPPEHLYKLVNNITTINLNSASYFLNILAYPDVLICYTTG